MTVDIGGKKRIGLYINNFNKFIPKEDILKFEQHDTGNLGNNFTDEDLRKCYDHRGREIRHPQGKELLQTQEIGFFEIQTKDVHVFALSIVPIYTMGIYPNL